MIDLIEEFSEYQITPLIPVLDEFEQIITDSLTEIDHTELNEKLLLEAKIYGELIQTLDKHGLRTFGLATGIKKYYSYFIIEVYLTDPRPKTIREIRIPLKNKPGKCI